MVDRFRLGLDTYSYHLSCPVWTPNPTAPLTLADYLNRAVDLRVDGLALADIRHFTSTDPATTAALEAQARQSNLYFEIGTGGVDEEHLADTLSLARRFGGNVLRTFVSTGRTWTTDDEWKENLPRVVEALRRMIPHCERSGVSLAIENHQDLTAVDLAEILDAVRHPQIGVCWDTGNSLGVLEHPLDGLALLANHVLTVHFKAYAVIPLPDAPPGYVLLSVPIDHSRSMLAGTLAILRQQSPAHPLHINVEAALECIPVMPARRGWRKEYTQRAAALCQTLGLDADQTEAVRHAWGWWPTRTDVPLHELQALEDRLVRYSVQQARQLLQEDSQATHSNPHPAA